MALSISTVSADEIPSTKHTGRKRTPSVFDAQMYDMGTDEWVRVEVPTAEDLAEFERELTKALNFAGKGADKRYGDGVAYFHVRPRIAKPRKARDDDNVTELESGKRQRKAS